MGLPTGMVTFLFSDIEGSTRLLQRLGDGTDRCSRAPRSGTRQAVADAAARR